MPGAAVGSVPLFTRPAPTAIVRASRNEFDLAVGRTPELVVPAQVHEAVAAGDQVLVRELTSSVFDSATAAMVPHRHFSAPFGVWLSRHATRCVIMKRAGGLAILDPRSFTSVLFATTRGLIVDGMIRARDEAEMALGGRDWDESAGPGAA